MAQQAAHAVDWCALPPEVLALCLSEEEHKRAALATHSSWAHAVVHDGVKLRLDVAREEAFAPSVRVLHKLWGPAPASASSPPGAWSSGQQAAKAKGVTLALCGSNKSPEQCLAELWACGTSLPFIATLRLEYLLLATPVPRGVNELLPNLQRLLLSWCECTAATGCLVSACSTLQHLEVRGGGVKAHHLSSLATLPRLSSLHLGLGSECSGVLPSLSSQLTALELHSGLRQCLGGTQQPAPAWRATLQHVAQCKQLRSLTIPCVTGEELALVAPALAQLRDLHLCGWPPGRGSVDGDAVVEALVGLPHLTSLRWDRASRYTLQRSYTKDPCRWKQLTLGSVTPQLLARLPLHSLTAPLAWEVLEIESGTSAADAQAAATAAARCPGGVAWRSFDDCCEPPKVEFLGPLTEDAFVHGATAADTPAALLRAMQPLIAALAPGAGVEAVALTVENMAWDAEAVRALGAGLPPARTTLWIENGCLPLPALVEMAHRLPQLEALDVTGVSVSPSIVLAYVSVVGALRRACEGLQEQGPRLKTVGVSCDALGDEDEEDGLVVAGPAVAAEWDRVQQLAREVGEGSEVQVAWC